MMNTEDLKDRVVSLIGMASDRIRVENLSCMDDRYGQGDKLLAKLRRLEEVDQLRLLAGEYERDIRNGADLDRWDSLEGVDGFVRR
jgi:hypothetical protein